MNGLEVKKRMQDLVDSAMRGEGAKTEGELKSEVLKLFASTVQDYPEIAALDGGPLAHVEVSFGIGPRRTLSVGILPLTDVGAKAVLWWRDQQYTPNLVIVSSNGPLRGGK